MRRSEPSVSRLQAAGAAGAWRLFDAPFAHRGLWAPQGAPENSLEAFAAAAHAGYGVELDVRLSADGVVMVFHDAHLARMTGAGAYLCERTRAELAALRLRNGPSHVPTLREALDVIGDRPVLIELKTDPGAEGPLESAVLAVLKTTRAQAAIIGFNPASHAWLAAAGASLPRGLNLGADWGSRPKSDRDVDLHAAAPDFILPAVSLLETAEVQALRAEGMAAIAWTLTSPERHAAAQAACDQVIFEGYAP